MTMYFKVIDIYGRKVFSIFSILSLAMVVCFTLYMYIRDKVLFKDNYK